LDRLTHPAVAKSRLVDYCHDFSIDVVSIFDTFNVLQVIGAVSIKAPAYDSEKLVSDAECW
jgi:hypothetical protein